MKRIFPLIFALIILSSSAFAEALFPDLVTVTKDRYGNETIEEHWAINEITKAAKINLIVGYEDGTFKPEADITRAEFIKMAMVLSTNRSFDFSIMPKCKVTGWAAPYVSAAEMQKVVAKGRYNDSNINEPITRIEMICILSKIQINMKGISQYREAELPFYTDINELTNDEKEMLLHALRYELIDGMRDTAEIMPNAKLTRAEAAVAIMRIY